MNNLVVVTSNFESFVVSLKSNLKLGYGVCQSTEYIHGFFRAVLAKGVDESYIASLNALTGKERENVIDLMCSLSDKSTVSVNVEVPVEVVVTEAVQPDIVVKRSRKQRVKKGGI
jgi:hypothetical protein